MCTADASIETAEDLDATSFFNSTIRLISGHSSLWLIFTTGWLREPTTGTGDNMWMFTKFGSSAWWRRDIPSLDGGARDSRLPQASAPSPHHHLRMRTTAIESQFTGTPSHPPWGKWWNPSTMTISRTLPRAWEYQRALGSVWRVMFEFQSRVVTAGG